MQNVSGGPGRGPRRHLALALAVAVAVASCGDDAEDPQPASTAEPDVPAEWLHLGYDLANTRAVPDETVIDTDNVDSLEVRWELSGVRGVSGTPVVTDGVVYVGDWSGHVRALDAGDGEELWAQDLSSNYVGGALALDDDHVFAGTFSGARMVALDRASGDVAWEAQLDEHPAAAVFGSPVHVDGLVIVGVGGFENFNFDAREFTFRGSVVALDAATGDEVWRYWTTCGPENDGRDNCADAEDEEGPGVAVWSSPAVDTERGHLYIGTGQHYDGPATGRSDAMIALDLATGEEAWRHQYTEGDIWSLPNQEGPDSDIGAPPNLFRSGGRDAVGAGDKAGVYKAIDRDTGELLWSKDLTDGGTQGGIMASAAVAGDTVFVASNKGGQAADLIALDVDGGEERWRVDLEGSVMGPVTWANGVLYLADNTGRIAAYDAEDGNRLWSHGTGAAAAGGIAVVDGTVYGGWGWWLAGAPEDPQGGLTAFHLGSEGGSADGGTEEAADGAQIYRQSCATCHGGDASGANGPALTGIGDRLSIAEQVAVVRDGRGEMPGWKDQLSPEAIQAVVDYLATL